eukprot:gene41772-43076_t
MGDAGGAQPKLQWQALSQSPDAGGGMSTPRVNTWATSESTQPGPSPAVRPPLGGGPPSALAHAVALFRRQREGALRPDGGAETCETTMRRHGGPWGFQMDRKRVLRWI